MPTQRKDRYTYYRHFLINITIGIIIAFPLWYFHNTTPLKELDDIGIDWIMKLYSGTSPNIDIPHFVVLDINEKTYSEWSEPLITPRDKLLQLIESSIKAEPRLIIVDIELNASSEEDAKLLEYLNQYANFCRENTCPHIIFARGLREKSNGNKNYWVQRKSLRSSDLDLDKIISDSNYLHWASVLFRNPSQEYGNLRYWYLSVPTYVETKPSQVDVVLPSVQLLTAVLINGIKEKNDQIESITELKNKLSSSTQKNEEIILNNDMKIILSPSNDLSSRVIYTLPWKNKKGESYPPSKEGMLLLNPIPANSFLPNPQQYSELLKGSIVVIGGSYQDSRDIHPTPLGSMPGYLVLINSIFSLVRFGQLESMSFVKYLFIESSLILLISYIFARFNSLKSMLILIFAIIIILMPASIYFFRLGIWLSFLTPLLGVFLHQLIAYVEELQELANRHSD